MFQGEADKGERRDLLDLTPVRPTDPSYYVPFNEALGDPMLYETNIQKTIPEGLRYINQALNNETYHLLHSLDEGRAGDYKEDFRYSKAGYVFPPSISLETILKELARPETREIYWHSISIGLLFMELAHKYFIISRLPGFLTGLLHDLGKTDPDMLKLVSKKGAFNRQERERVKDHVYLTFKNCK